KDEDPDVRANAVAQLYQQRQEAVPLFLEALKDPEPRVRSAAASYLGAIRPVPKEALPALTEAVKDPDSNVRYRAVGGVGGVGPEAIPVLVEAMKNATERHIKMAVAGYLGQHGAKSKDAVAALAEALKDGDVSVRGQVAWALGQIGPDAKDALP